MDVTNGTTVTLIFNKMGSARFTSIRYRAGMQHLRKRHPGCDAFHGNLIDQILMAVNREFADGYAELRCGNGEWHHPTGKELVAMYRSCKLPTLDATVEWGRTLAQLGYVASTASLLVASAIFIYLRKLQCGRNRIHFNLFLSFLLRSIFSIIQFAHSNIFRTTAHPDPFTVSCKFITALWNYLIISSYFWIFVEGLYLHNIVYWNIFKEPSVWPYAITAWGVPLAICTCWIIVKVLNDHSSCWLTMDMEYQLILKIPLTLITLLEVLITLNIARQLYYKLKDDSVVDHSDKYRKLAKSTLYLICGTGVNFFIFDVALTVYDLFALSPKIAHSAYVVINSFWGFFVSILYCFNSEEIANDWRLKVGNRRLTSSLRRELKNASDICSHKRKRPWLNMLRMRSECAECKIRKKLIANNIGQKSNGNVANGTDTQCSSVMNSAENTLRSDIRSQRIRIAHLAFCTEEEQSELDSEV
ncbi:Parathyroid hormone/parathyroid hormone-related peptide receptor [Toxocara canis]|uniref:Parathyroid hormone/parathyroid hormone-related peptide receptor n=1 Tax=Toxocara canis TaxID=6265 RepID=A0A0B2VDG0_TOXCA|nr:Parathyroid hormone/parathyroid hormone-related peptide receptor [Toxocara canis]